MQAKLRRPALCYGSLIGVGPRDPGIWWGRPTCSPAGFSLRIWRGVRAAPGLTATGRGPGARAGLNTAIAAPGTSKASASCGSGHWTVASTSCSVYDSFGSQSDGFHLIERLILLIERRTPLIERGFSCAATANPVAQPQFTSVCGSSLKGTFLNNIYVYINLHLYINCILYKIHN